MKTILCIRMRLKAHRDAWQGAVLGCPASCWCLIRPLDTGGSVKPRHRQLPNPPGSPARRDWGHRFPLGGPASHGLTPPPAISAELSLCPLLRPAPVLTPSLTELGTRRHTHTARPRDRELRTEVSPEKTREHEETKRPRRKS